MATYYNNLGNRTTVRDIKAIDNNVGSLSTPANSNILTISNNVGKIKVLEDSRVQLIENNVRKIEVHDGSKISKITNNVGRIILYGVVEVGRVENCSLGKIIRREANPATRSANNGNVHVPPPPAPAVTTAYRDNSSSATRPTNNLVVPLPRPLPPALTTATATQKSSNSSEELESVGDLEANECPICLSNRRNTALGCGHLCCSRCAGEIGTCHICREPITARIKLYL